MRLRLALFLVTMLAGTAPVLADPAAQASRPAARDVIDTIRKHAGAPWQGLTVDTIKAGDPNTPVTGIATTFAATYDVLQRAAAAGANLIVTHEPTFYSHMDETKPLEHDSVYLQKLAFIRDHHMVVWRFHDHWHQPGGNQPDGIRKGMVRALGWDAFQKKGDDLLYVMPETTLQQLAAEIEHRLGIHAMRVVGDPKLKVRNVALLPGASGADRQIQALERDDVQALVVGEAREWETVEYARDAFTQQKPKALIILGHVMSEEAGMDYCAEWLRQFLPGIPVTFIPAKEPFWKP